MKLSVLGVNFRTAPVEIRERACFTASSVPGVLRRISEEFPGAEAALLSTCNRTELYTAGIDAEARKRALIGILLRETDPDKQAAAEKHFYEKKDLAVAEHLLAVAAGLDSMVVGETEILGQVKQAYTLARQTWTKGKAMDPLFQNAFRIAKRVHTETDLSQGRVSTSSIAVEFAEKLFDNLRDKTVMIVGAGKTAELALKSLIERGAKEVLVLNRSPERAGALAGRYGGRAIQFELLDEYLPRADILISSTSAPHCVVREASVRKALEARRGLPLLLIDIAVPRNIEAAVGDLENVYLYNIDDLQRGADENLARRRGAIDDAWKIVREGAAEIASMFKGADLRDILRQLDELGRNAAEAALRKTFAKERIAALPEEAREEMRLVAQKVVGKMLTEPREALKRASETDRWKDYAETVIDLFKFSPGHVDRNENAAKGKEDE